MREQIPQLLENPSPTAHWPAPRVVAIDFQRDELDFGGDFAGSRELQFGVGDLRAMGYEANIVRVLTGTLGQLYDQGMEDRLIEQVIRVGADLVFTKMHVSDRLVQQLHKEGIRTLFLRSYHIRPPEGLYQYVVDGDVRYALLELVEELRRGQAPADEEVIAPQVPVAQPGRRATDTMAFVDLKRFRPAVDFIDAASGEQRLYQRFALITNRGCPYSAPIEANPLFADLDLDAERYTMRGCSFCEMGGDYVKLPVPDYADYLCGQIAYYAEHAPGSEMLVSDEAAFDSLARLLDHMFKRGIEGVTLLVKGRIEGLLKRMDRFEKALGRADQHHIRVVFFLIGIENFSDAELLRYNKGITQADVISCIERLDRLEQRFEAAFSWREYRSHGFILFNPWTTLDDLNINLEMFQRFRMDRLTSKAPWSRMRLYRWQPLAPLAVRDGLIDEQGRFSELVRGHLGYASNELHWRFKSPLTELVYLLVSEGIERHPKAISGGFKILQLAIAFAQAVDDPHKYKQHIEAFIEHLFERYPPDGEGIEFGDEPTLPQGMINKDVITTAAKDLSRRAARLPWTLASVHVRDFGYRLEFRHRSKDRTLVVKLSPRKQHEPSYTHSRRCNLQYLPTDFPFGRTEDLFLKAFALALAEAEIAGTGA